VGHISLLHCKEALLKILRTLLMWLEVRPAQNRRPVGAMMQQVGRNYRPVVRLLRSGRDRGIGVGGAPSWAQNLPQGHRTSSTAPRCLRIGGHVTREGQKVEATSGPQQPVRTYARQSVRCTPHVNACVLQQIVWAARMDHGIYRLGVSQAAAASVGGIGFVDLADVGSITAPGRPFGMVEGTGGMLGLETELPGVRAPRLCSHALPHDDARRHCPVFLAGHIVLHPKGLRSEISQPSYSRQ
jgi:hypothetical protein